MLSLVLVQVRVAIKSFAPICMRHTHTASVVVVVVVSVHIDRPIIARDTCCGHNILRDSDAEAFKFHNSSWQRQHSRWVYGHCACKIRKMHNTARTYLYTSQAKRSPLLLFFVFFLFLLVLQAHRRSVLYFVLFSYLYSFFFVIPSRLGFPSFRKKMYTW